MQKQWINRGTKKTQDIKDKKWKTQIQLLITLNERRLNKHIKRQRLSDWNKKQDLSYAVYKRSFRFKDLNRLTVKT